MTEENAEEKGKYNEKIETLEKKYDRCSDNIEILTIQLAEFARDLENLKKEDRRRKR